MYCSTDTLIQPHILWFPRTLGHEVSTQILLCCFQTVTPFILEQMTILNNQRPRRPCFWTDSVIKATFKFIGARKPKRAYYWSKKNISLQLFGCLPAHLSCGSPTNQCNNKRLQHPFQPCLHRTNARTLFKKQQHTPKVRQWPRSGHECNLQTITFMKRKANEAWLVRLRRRVGGQRLPDGMLANSSAPDK